MPRACLPWGPHLGRTLRVTPWGSPKTALQCLPRTMEEGDRNWSYLVLLHSLQHWGWTPDPSGRPHHAVGPFLTCPSFRGARPPLSPRCPLKSQARRLVLSSQARLVAAAASGASQAAASQGLREGAVPLVAGSVLGEKAQ